MLKSSSWRLQLQYYLGVLEQTQRKAYMVIGYIEDRLHSHKFFNVLINSNHTRIKNVKEGKCHL